MARTRKQLIHAWYRVPRDRSNHGGIRPEWLLCLTVLVSAASDSTRLSGECVSDQVNDRLLSIDSLAVFERCHRRQIVTGYVARLLIDVVSRAFASAARRSGSSEAKIRLGGKQAAQPCVVPVGLRSTARPDLQSLLRPHDQPRRTSQSGPHRARRRRCDVLFAVLRDGTL